jgi:hypothetical protein
MAKVFSNKSLRLSMGCLATMPWIPVDREEDPWPLGMMDVGWGLFIEHLVGAQKLKGLKTPFKSTKPPAKTTPNKQKINGSQSKNGFVPKINKKKTYKNNPKLKTSHCTQCD